MLPGQLGYNCLQCSLEASILHWFVDLQHGVSASAIQDSMPVAGHLVGVSYNGPLPFVSALKGSQARKEAL